MTDPIVSPISEERLRELIEQARVDAEAYGRGLLSWEARYAKDCRDDEAALRELLAARATIERLGREVDTWKFTADEQSKNVGFLRDKEQQAIRRADQECNDADDLIEQLGLNVEQCRTDGGWLNVPKIISKLQDDPPWTSKERLQRPGWQPIETAPKDGTVILLASVDHVYAGRWHNDSTWPWLVLCEQHETNGLKAGDMLRWQPLPDAPLAIDTKEG